MIGGNVNAIIQKKTVEKNKIGEPVESWKETKTIRGWLDYSNGANDLSKYNAKVQDTSHIFICDPTDNISAENCRMIIKDNIYSILHIDNPMEMNKHLEIYLKYIGGGISV